MVFEKSVFSNIYLKRFIASMIDFGVEIGGALLGGYFGAMMAALVIVLHNVSPEHTQKAVWTGMSSGFFFWGVVASVVNRVVVQGMSRASVGKKLMDLEIISTGAPITWQAMFKHWVSGSIVGDVRVVSSLDVSKVAPVYSIHSQPAVAKDVEVSSESSDKKAA